MLISQILITGIFLAVVILILLEKFNRAVITLTGAVLSYFILIFIEHDDFGMIVGFLFGTQDDGFVNLQSIVLIFSMSIIVNISHSSGVFSYLAFRFVQMVAKKPQRLLPILCLISFILSMLLNNILTVMILIPLTITISRMLNFDPEPYIITQAILVNIGGTVFSISSIPNILITLSANISFNDFFMNVGLFSIVVFFITTAFFYLLHKGQLTFDSKNITILMEFQPLHFIQSKPLFNKSLAVLGGVLVCFLAIPSQILPAYIIALTGALILIFISKVDQGKLMEKIDTELFLYLMGVFIVAGAVEEVGVIQALGNGMNNLTRGNGLGTVLLLVWVSAILSSMIDNIPITQVLIPVAHIIAVDSANTVGNDAFYSLAFGSNWGDNLTPMGDNILVMNLAKKNKRPISMKKFFKLGFETTIIQLFLVSIFYGFKYNILIGAIFLITFLGIMITWIGKNSERFFGKKLKSEKIFKSKIKKNQTPIPDLTQQKTSEEEDEE